MTLPEPEIERLLRQAPRPAAPAGLRQAILREAPSGLPARSAVFDSPWLGWLNSRRVALGAVCLALATLGVVAVQQAELSQLRLQVDDLRRQLEARRAPAPTPNSALSSTTPAATVQRRSDREDLERLRVEVPQLQAEKARLEALAAENQALRSELVATPPRMLPDDVEALRQVRDRAQQRRCMNNLKQLGLAVRLYATDNHDVFPVDMLSITNYLGTPKILWCPADTNRQWAASWNVFTPANLSYEYLAADGSETDASRVLFRCSVHRGNVGLCDGSVAPLSEQMQAERLVTKNGKLYLSNEAPPTAPEQLKP